MISPWTYWAAFFVAAVIAPSSSPRSAAESIRARSSRSGESILISKVLGIRLPVGEVVLLQLEVPLALVVPAEIDDVETRQGPAPQLHDLVAALDGLPR